MKVALVHRDLGEPRRGGICTVFMSLGEQLLRLGWDVVLVTQRADGIAGDGQMQIERINPVDDFGRSVVAFLHDLEPDVVECSTWDADLLPLALAPTRPRSALVVRADLPGTYLGDQGRGRDEALLLARADATVAVSLCVRDLVQQAYAQDVDVVIPNGFDPRVFHPGSCGPLTEVTSGRVLGTDSLAAVPGLAERPITSAYRSFERAVGGRPAVVWVGKPTHAKGWDIFCELSRALAKEAAFLAVLGHGDPAYALKDRPHPSSLIVQDVSNADLARIYRRATFVLSTSRWEGFQLTNLEALACGARVLIPSRLRKASHHYLEEPGVAVYSSVGDIRRGLAEQRRPSPTSRVELTWRANAIATLRLYCEALRRAGTRSAVAFRGAREHRNDS